MGYGVLLWSIDDPPVDSGTVLPVYIKSNIEKIWVIGLPDTARGNKDYKLEIPLAQLEFIGSRSSAIKWAQEFSRFALYYGENLQDGLPIRDFPDNNSQRVYRLRLGEIIKILDIANGIPPISTTGEPLPGDWYKVMTADGAVGYCFSYRLRIFNQNEGSVQSANTSKTDTAPDPDLERVLSRRWSPEIYLQMINTRRINTQMLERNYRFDPGQETGIARIILPDLEREFSYDRIVPDGERVWRFEGTNLQMVLRTNTTLAVQFAEGTGSRRTILFVSLSRDLNDIILQENERRNGQFASIYDQGPAFTSNNYGTITFLRTGDFVWKGFELLVPQHLSDETKGNGRINMDLFISPSYEDRYNGAFTMRFTDVRQKNTVYFMYSLDNQGLRLEIVPDYGIEESTVMRRSSTPVVLYFFRDNQF